MPASGGMNAGIGAGPMGYISLLNDGKVLKELNLSDEQQAKVAAAVGEAANVMSTEMKNGFRAMSRNASPRDPANIMSNAAKKQQDKLLKKLDKILQPEQLNRLKQIHMQADGPMALFDPEVARSLKITPEQQEKMKALMDDFQNAMSQSVKGHQDLNSGGAMMKLDGKRTKELTEKMYDVLTEEQRAEFEKMKGPKADIGHSSFKMEGRNE